METQTLIIGGGLAGLALAEALQAKGVDYLLVEARDRLGGRVLTEAVDGAGFDLGPAWFWPGQPRMAALIARLGLEKFGQFEDGILTFEDETGHVERGRGFASMQGSWRLKGGLGRLITGLADRLPDDRKRLNAEVLAIANTDKGVAVGLSNGDQITADRVVLAVPPRIAAGLKFDPAMPDTTMTAMEKIATWMAGQAKVVAVYNRPFWRDAGLSGDAMSRQGPMVEVHDASPADGGPFALFGFIGVPPKGRQDEPLLRQHLLAQLGRLFGPDAQEPRQLYIKDWAFDRHTATALDQVPLHAHPQYGLPRAMADLWNGQILFGGTEVAGDFGGYLEGALEAAENVLDQLSQVEVSRTNAR